MHTRRFALRPFLVLALAALTGQSHLSAQVTLPYTVDFEPSENFSPGSLQGQGGWRVERGGALIGSDAAFSGANAVTLSAGTPPTAISQSFTRFFGEDVIFVDFYSLPVADGNPGMATRMDVEAAQAGFFRIGEQGEVYALDGDGQGGGQWVATDFTVPLDEHGRARDWIRFTFRQDFTAKIWDLYLDGTLVKADLHFRDNTATSFSRFRLRGAAGADSAFDYFYASGDNPLFTDEDKDGMDDAWELANGLDPTVNDRNLVSGKLANIQRYLSAEKAGRTQADAKIPTAPTRLAAADAISAISGLRLRLQADAGVTADGSGFVSTWADQSGLGKNATQSTSARRPVLVTNVINGNPVIRFSSASTQYLNVANFMSGATEGEVFAVVKAGPTAGSGIWRFGPGANQAYYSLNGLDDDFGTNVQRDTGVPVAGVDSFCIYNIAGKSGSWVQRLNGGVHFMATTNTVGAFNTAPTIGLNYSASYFTGDIAEIIVYDHVLTAADRDSVGTFLQTKYALPGISAPSTPTSLAAIAISSTQANLTWAGTPSADGLTYTIERQAGAGSFTFVADVENTLGYFDTGLTAGTTYTYRIKSRNYAGTTGYSSTASVTMPASGPTDFPLTNMRLWLRADAGITGGAARVLTWYDQSTRANQATQKTVSKEPIMVTNVLNGRPVVRFDSTQSRNLGLTDFMNGASEGEIFAVLKWTTGGGGLWRLGPGANVVSYSTSGIADDFGSSTTRSSAVTVAGADNFTLYNVSAKSGSWTQRINGAVHFSATSNTVGTFNSTPLLGVNYTASYFNGDIAEVIAYDHALTAADREAVGVYLQKKYALPGITAPSAPFFLTATTVSSTQVNLAWGDTPAADGLIYTIERQTGAGSFAPVTEVTGALGYLDTGLTPGATYTYRLSARNYAGTSGYGNTASVTMPAAGPADMPTANLRLWLRADAGITEGAGRVVAWYDQSTQANQATQSTTVKQPVLVTNAVNGRPAVRFNAAQSQYFNLTNFMNGATEGEIFAVLKAGPGAGSGLWRLGPGANVTSYAAGSGITDDFGSTAVRSTGTPAASLGSFTLYNISAKSGSWISRFDGAVHFTANTNTVGFNTLPLLGLNYTAAYFSGDIAEVIVYDHALTSTDRDAVGRYLQAKYALPGITAPNVPGSLTATTLSTTQTYLTWTDTPTPGIIYTVERQTGAGAFTAVSDVTGGLGYLDTGLTAGVVYNYRVRARNAIDTSAYSNTATAAMPASSGTELSLANLRLWLRADAGITEGSGRVINWFDQSGQANLASQLTVAQEPQLVTNAVNGRPVVRFDASQSQFFGLTNFMNGATEAELFAVVKAGPGAGAGLWRLGAGANVASYSTSGLSDDFGSSVSRSMGTPVVATDQYRIYHIAAQSGSWTSRLDGNLQYASSTGNSVGTFNTLPLLGLNYNAAYFSGDVAELFVYDHALNSFKRGGVLSYLESKYGFTGIKYPAPDNLVARPVSSYQVSLSWTKIRPGTSYTVERQTGAGSFQVVAVTSDSTYLDEGLNPNTSYSYRLHADATDGDLSYGNTSTVTTLPLFLAFPQSGLRLWLSPDSIAANGSDVPVWHDLSGNGNDATQVTAANRPQLATTPINGRPAVHFDGTSSYLNLPFPMNGATAGDLFVVLRAQTPNSTDRTVLSVSGRLQYPSASGQIADSFASSTDHAAAPGVDLTQVHIYNATSSGSEWTSRLERQTVFTTATNTVAMGSGSPAPLLGADTVSGAPGKWFAGDIAEIVIYDRVLSDPERQVVQQQLAARYGLAVAFPGDAGNNGLPDAWETLTFGVAGIDPHGDPDGDGKTTATEYFAATNPVDFFNGRAETLGGDGKTDFTYDASGRLVLAAYTNGLQVKVVSDAAGNLTTSSGDDGGSTAWRIGYSLPADGSGLGADAASPANDGVSNLVKFGLGLDPTVAVGATANVVQVTLVNVGGSNYLALTYERPDPPNPALSYTVEVSADGVTWTSGTGATVDVSTVVNAGVATVVVRDATPVGSPAFGRKIRLSVGRTSTP